ncbi:competence protein ComK [Neobacillus mesonae]|uniref:competence protein ComK n=1 Tax=Neobacillus mesonae TaxID=1193713 RepID=UPI002E222AB5|nr:competence protein ComK [Neobacillus mesonae]MED4206830.1 competence protein ComK [Neobacillus mesonae]
MEIKRNHIINEKTILFYGVLYKNGELFTKVIEGDDMFLVAMTPLQFINQSLIKYGSDLKGALNSSKKLLGEKQKKYPIKISLSLDIYLFPTKSIKREDCVWFAPTSPAFNGIRRFCKSACTSRRICRLHY